MRESVKIDHLYRVENGKWFDTAVMPDAVSKLNLFCDDKLVNQVNGLTRLLQSFGHELVLSMEKKSLGAHWSLWAEHSVLLNLRELLIGTDFDYLLWPEGVNQSPKLMVFDMDSTFIEIEVIDELAKFHNVGDEVAKVTEKAMRGEMDFAESLVSRVATLKGLDDSAITRIADNLPLSVGVESLVSAGAHHLCHTAIVSGGFCPFVKKLKHKLQLYKVKANQLEIKAGKLTGKVNGKIVDAQAKALFIEELCVELNLHPNQVIAIGDGANDLLMMQAAGFNLAYRAKPKVQQQANGRMNHVTLDRLIGLFDW